jgi:osmotically inducible protein OsmC
MANTLYEATSTAWGGRDGHVASEDGRVDLNLSLPKGMGGDDGPGTNPEQLFATGYAACFHRSSTSKGPPSR